MTPHGSEEERPPQPRRRGHLREVASALCILVACLAFTVATPAVWAHRNFLDTSRFVSRAAPLADDPAVQQAVTERLTQEVMAVVDPQALFRSVLPERGQVLAVPLTSAVRGFVSNTVSTFVQSDAFKKLWTAALTTAHKAAISVLNGERRAILVRDGVVTLNLVPMIDGILGVINRVTPDVLGRDIQLPTIDSSESAGSAASRLAAALNVKLPASFGQIVIYNRAKLDKIQEALHLFDRFIVVSLVASLVFAVGALLITRRRRRALIYLAGGLAVAMVLLRRVVFRILTQVTAIPPTEAGRNAIAAVLHAFLDPLTTFAAWAVLAALGIMAVAGITSGHPWAIGIRHRSAQLSKSIWSRLGTDEEQGPARWVHAHVGVLNAACAAVTVLILWFADLSWVGVLVVLGLAAVYAIAVQRLSATATPRPSGGVPQSGPAGSSGPLPNRPAA